MAYSITQTIGGFRVTTPFKAVDRLHPNGHKGLDLAMPEGTTLHAINGGKVVFSGWDDKLGNYVKIHGYDNTDIIYGHLKETSVDTGDFILQGQEIGLSGTTGRSTGPHLHLQVSENGQLLDPTEYAAKLGGVSDVHNSSPGVLDMFRNVSDFIQNTHDKGLWYGLTGHKFKESLIIFGNDLISMMVQCSDVLVVVTMILGIGAITGSKFCKKWAYYSTMLFIILKCVGGALV